MTHDIHLDAELTFGLKVPDEAKLGGLKATFNPQPYCDKNL